MTEYRLRASVRKNLSGSYRRSLFRRGLIPAVVYGKTVKSLPLEVPEKDVRGVLGAGRNTIVNLVVSGNGGPYKVMVRDLQFDPLTKAIIHADFQQISLRDKIHASVPIHLSGEAAGGLPRLSLRELEISCLPAKVPAQITVDVSGMKPGESITVSDLQVPRGVNVLTGPDVTVVTVLAPEEEAVDRDAGEVSPPEAAG
ncbi:MAG: 50S ribosomal protein L25 [Peptococcaceae bacterium]|nr:50S ribosomal protein L25 [Peptococcaceae bacterium]